MKDTEKGNLSSEQLVELRRMQQKFENTIDTQNDPIGFAISSYLELFVIDAKSKTLKGQPEIAK